MIPFLDRIRPFRPPNPGSRRRPRPQDGPDDPWKALIRPNRSNPRFRRRFSDYRKPASDLRPRAWTLPCEAKPPYVPRGALPLARPDPDAARDRMRSGLVSRDPTGSHPDSSPPRQDRIRTRLPPPARQDRIRTHLLRRPATPPRTAPTPSPVGSGHALQAPIRPVPRRLDAISTRSVGS